MEKRFTPQERTAIRNEFVEHPIYRMIKEEFPEFDPQMQNINLYSEEVFFEVAKILDDIKENGTLFDIEGLWKILIVDFRVLDPSIPQEERQLLLCMIITFVSITLCLSDDGVHQLMAEELIQLVQKYYPDAISNQKKMIDSSYFLREELGLWIQDFMKLDNDFYLSDYMGIVMHPESPKQNKQAKQFKPVKTTYSRKNLLEGQIDMLYHGLERFGWIANTGRQNFRQLFDGKDSICQITWLGKDKDGSTITINALGTLICTMIENGSIEVPKGYGYIDILKSHIIMESGNHPNRIEGGNVNDKNNRLSEKVKAKVRQLIQLISVSESFEDEDF